jgi:hypothetical protein
VGLEEQALLELIYKKYEHHFAKLRELNPMISISAQTTPPEYLLED